MINPRTNQLIIFENFRKKTPDTKNKTIPNHVFEKGSELYQVAENIVNFRHVHAEELYFLQSELEMQAHTNNIIAKRKVRLLNILKRIKGHWRDFNFNPLTFFKQIKHQKHPLQLMEASQEKFKTLLQQASNNHQIALRDKLVNEQNRITRELAMIEAGIKTFLTEQDIIRFTKKASRKVKLDWIQNFTRFIPAPIQQIIQTCEDHSLFDNYVILHYDPDSKGSEMTAAEKKKAADPILFGVIEGSRRLYYLGDWIDDYCDLTLSQLLDKLNETEAAHQLHDHLVE